MPLMSSQEDERAGQHRTCSIECVRLRKLFCEATNVPTFLRLLGIRVWRFYSPPPQQRVANVARQG